MLAQPGIKPGGAVPSARWAAATACRPRQAGKVAARAPQPSSPVACEQPGRRKKGHACAPEQVGVNAHAQVDGRGHVRHHQVQPVHRQLAQQAGQPAFMARQARAARAASMAGSST